MERPLPAPPDPPRSRTTATSRLSPSIDRRWRTPSRRLSTSSVFPSRLTVKRPPPRRLDTELPLADAGEATHRSVSSPDPDRHLRLRPSVDARLHLRAPAGAHPGAEPGAVPLPRRVEALIGFADGGRDRRDLETD